MPVYDNTVSTKVSDDTLQDIEEYADEHGMNRSAAVRHHLQRSLNQDDRGPGAYVSYGAMLTVVGLSFASIQYADASGAVGPFGIALAVGGLGYDLAHRLGYLPR